jgi:hypothetical protein
MAAKVPWKATKMNSGITTPLLKVAAVENAGLGRIPDAVQEGAVEAAEEGGLPPVKASE